ncbi:glycogen debranching protein GlgX [Naumannella sp. ID2617S]|uniref:Glycogen debranching enzyme GlgX n=1 Tax=Enemella dayhoffiae TaxID=2016507 RepID=A0A255H031_9ACTN|nr:glycogen debranching protein GlgX [Enemella dayhoffiae]NNG18975.1 glycogen debranching protein GlgX [Naumannella sp. ID2617S]OYO19284.1 glycogen debranching enzyme GlgX [Enemella dayhoffiae]
MTTELVVEELPAPLDSSILGARLQDGGCHFALWAPRAKRVELALVAEDLSQRNHDMTRNDDGVWVVFVPGVEAEQRYGFRVHGDWAPTEGSRFNPARLLLDPYARAITAGVDYNGPILDHPEHDDYELDPTDSTEAVPLSVVVAETAAPTPIAQRRPMSESVIYETHVKGYTQLHPAVPEHLRGTYAGLAYPAVVEHLVSLGITAVELLPCHHFVSEPFIIGRGLSNYWGYNTLGFFAPHAAYCSVGTLGQQVAEFKQMVSALHEAGIEVILDVVYNHTGEGGHEGPTLSFRGIDHGGYYRLTEDLRNDYDVTGCGNSVDTSEPGVLALVLDSMRYWVTEMGVDGFRFDLASELIRDRNHHVDQEHAFKKAIAEDPAFEGIKMIAEPWDMGPFGYQVGRWGAGWSEWNDHFRNFTRDWWRGAISGVQELAGRLCGSPDTYEVDGRDTSASVNFITAHDGFTLRDLVTYDGKHNEANGEENRDGADDNRSWNCGHEGETDDPGINALRHRQVKNMMATLCLAVGVPMITAGDEMGRTQGGNNNAYCQDSPISWVHWDTLDTFGDLLGMTKEILRLRSEFPALRAENYRHHEEVTDADGNGLGRVDLTWFHQGGVQMGEDEWHDGGRRTLGMYTSDADSAFLIWFHGDPSGIEVTLPGDSWAKGWRVVVHSGFDGEFPSAEEVLDAGSTLGVPGRSVVVLQAEL